MQTTQSPYEGLYEPLNPAQARAYLDRIRFKGTPEPTLDCLTRLIDCQLHAVPFENLDVFHGHREPSLNTADLFQKIVTNRRGGYCFELNGLFWRLLEAVGFRCWTVLVRIVLGRDYLTPFSHRSVIVELGEKRYLCDVGFGASTPVAPLEMADAPAVQTAGRRRYQFTRQSDWTTLNVEQEDGLRPMLLFREEPSDPVDFIAPNANCALPSRSRFRESQVVTCLLGDGRGSINGAVLRVERNGALTERVLDTEQALRDALRTEFGLEYEGPLRDWRG